MERALAGKFAGSWRTGKNLEEGTSSKATQLRSSMRSWKGGRAAGASQPGVGCTLLYGPRLLLARLLNLLSLRRNTEKLMMAADTPRNSSKTTTAVRGSGAGRKLHPVRRLADMRKTLVLLSLELHLHPGRPQVLLQSVMRVRSTTLFSLWIQAKDNDDDDVDDEFADRHDASMD